MATLSRMRMQLRTGALLLGIALLVAWPREVKAGETTTTVTCASKPGEKQHCAGDTPGGVALQLSTGECACLLGRSWGYDAQGVWVSDGCAGEFVLGRTASAPEGAPEPKAYTPVQMWSMFEPGK